MTEFVAEEKTVNDLVTEVNPDAEVLVAEEPSLDFKTGRNMKFSDVITLLVNPKAFFESHIALLKTQYVYALLVILGIENVMERVDKGLLRSGSVDQANNFYMWIGNNGWPVYWGSVLIIGALSGIIVWTIRGWWYNVRLSWCGVKDFDKDHGRAVFAYNASLPAIATILLAASQTLFYPDYLSAFNAAGTGSFELVSLLLVLALTMLSYVNSYRSVTGVFKAKKGMAMILFLALPVVLAFSGILLYILS